MASTDVPVLASTGGDSLMDDGGGHLVCVSAATQSNHGWMQIFGDAESALMIPDMLHRLPPSLEVGAFERADFTAMVPALELAVALDRTPATELESVSGRSH